MFRVPPHPSSGSYNCISSLWFYHWNVEVASLLLMMGVEEPETCWATHKRQVINLWNCCIWLVNLFELYDDGRVYQRQINCSFDIVNAKWGTTQADITEGPNEIKRTRCKVIYCSVQNMLALCLLSKTRKFGLFRLIINLP